MLKPLLIALLLTSFVLLAAQAGAQGTYAERLGLPVGARVVIFHVDDAGMSHSSNLGAIEATSKGLASSVSTMMPCGWVPEFAAYLREHAEVDNGVHLTLTSEWKKYRWVPLAGRDVVPGLVDPEGCLWPEVEQVAKSASPEEVEKEIRAQLARAKSLGIPITHLDTHMGTIYARPEYLMAAVKVALENQIPLMLPGGHLTYVSQTDGESVQALKNSGILEQVWAGGLPLLDDVATGVMGSHPKEQVAENLLEMLPKLKPGLTQIIVHCTRPTEEFKEISGSGPTRLAELNAMLDPRVKKCIKDQGIIITTWRELKERRDRVATQEQGGAQK